VNVASATRPGWTGTFSAAPVVFSVPAACRVISRTRNVPVADCGPTTTV
jgi:hypothetical protein